MAEFLSLLSLFVSTVFAQSDGNTTEYANLPFTTTAMGQIMSIISNIDDSKNKQSVVTNTSPSNRPYEYVEITIFASVIFICFCTVFFFLSCIILRQKSSPSARQRERKQSTPNYKIQINAVECSGSNQKKSLNYLRSPSYNQSRNNLVSPSAMPSHISFSKDITPTPAVSLSSAMERDETLSDEEQLDGNSDDIYTMDEEGTRREKKEKNKYVGSGYKWIEQTLQRVDSQRCTAYLNNFKQHKVEDNRLAELNGEDLKELIPQIGPRNDFKRLYQMRYAHHGANEHKFEYDAETITTIGDSVYTDDMPNDLQSEYTSETASTHSTATTNLLFAIAKHKNPKYGGRISKISHCGNKGSALSALSSEFCDKESVLSAPSTIVSDTSIPETHSSISSQPLSSKKQRRYAQREQSNLSASSGLSMPIPEDADPQAVMCPLPENDESTDSDLVSIPRFEADMDSDTSTENEDESEGECESSISLGSTHSGNGDDDEDQ